MSGGMEKSLEARAAGGSCESGMALVAVLWIVSSAALLVSTFNATMRSGASLARSEMQLTKIEAMLDAGVEIAAARLIDNNENRRWDADGEPRSVSFAGTDLTISIYDQGGLVDLNFADSDLLLGLFRQLAPSGRDAIRLHDQIMIARGEDADELRKARNRQSARPGGRTARQPAAANKKAAPAAAPFVDVAQIRRLEGMTQDFYERIWPFLTVYNTGGQINEEIAPAEVLAALPQPKTQRTSRRRTASPAGRRARTGRNAGGGGNRLSQERVMVYVVMIQIGLPGAPYHTGREAVIATGLDEDAPYRLIAWKTLPRSG